MKIKKIRLFSLSFLRSHLVLALVLAFTVIFVEYAFSVSAQAQTTTMSKCGCVPECKCTPECKCDSGEPFLQIMDRMMMKMDAVPLTDAVERNFLDQMIRHHEGALEMALYESMHGNDFEMVQLAKSILAEQQGEILDMQAMQNTYPTGSGAASSEYKDAMAETMSVMMKNTPASDKLPKNIDYSFAMTMLPHHQAAVDMAVAFLKLNPKGQAAIYAKRIIGDQQVEIEQLNDYIQRNCQK